MAKIIKMVNKQEAEQEVLIQHIEELLAAAKEGKLKNIMTVAESAEGEVMTGYCNLDLAERQYMISHAEIDIHWDVVRANVDQIIEIIE